MILTSAAGGTRRLTGRHLGRYRAEVVDVDDPRSTGRVRLRVPELLGDVESGWALPTFAATGDGSGIFAIPPVGALVWVEFEGGDTSRPVWVGGWFADGSAPEGASPQKIVIRTPGGRTVTLDDDGGKLEIVEAGGASIVLDANGIELAKGGQKVVIGSSTVTINDGALEVS
jgi:uncharacterized protein involved in type VI secretion and phage assembly